jgi:hypothetical protein
VHGQRRSRRDQKLSLIVAADDPMTDPQLCTPTLRCIATVVIARI